ncbi:MAG: tRNA lysidine(34) synthetase TilS [Alphaproteobacteria bacterium]|nr:tRNA lysidine(34) synthetase TilS [Alphaproteobacteria bacterium]
MERCFAFKAKRVAVALSGGPDSMALACLLAEWGAANGVEVHALTVDHGLRKESAKEAKQVAAWVKGWPVKHKILKWTGRKPKTRLMEEARAARYLLMVEYCRGQKIKYLFLAHHQDDQAETFLLRLAAGSGLDGLAGMKPVQDTAHGIILLRPFLKVSKEDLILTCHFKKISYVKDPSNETERFARPRLRKARKVLEEEGLSSKRLAVTAARLARAQKALDGIADKSFKTITLENNTKRIVLNDKLWLALPEEVALRVLIKAMELLRPEARYRPRMEKIEDLFGDLFSPGPFRKRTLGGLVFKRERGNIIIAHEGG